MTSAATFLDFLAQSLGDRTFVRATLSKPGRAAPADLRSVYLRPVVIRGETLVAWTRRMSTRDEVKNLTAAQTMREVADLAGATFLHLDAESAGRAATLRFNKRGEPAVHFRQTGSAVLTAEDLRHDRVKHTTVDAAASCWRELGITGLAGSILPSAQDKWRQINKFTEIVDGLLKKTELPETVRAADMGSGKGYLTFALHALLVARGLKVAVTGIERRGELVGLCERTARRCGCEGLEFREGGISDWGGEPLELLIALHACDTATDDAIAAGVKGGARLMVLAPCCHQQVRQSMEVRAAHPAMGSMLRHGILRERYAEMVTDTLRALYLEREGYRTQVFEFISAEHTAKNVMITAVKEDEPVRPVGVIDEEIAQLKAHAGLARHALEERLGC